MTKWDQLWFMQITLIFKSRDKKKIVNLKTNFVTHCSLYNLHQIHTTKTLTSIDGDHWVQSNSLFIVWLIFDNVFLVHETIDWAKKSTQPNP
jgi:hypothetical protein